MTNSPEPDGREAGKPGHLFQSSKRLLMKEYGYNEDDDLSKPSRRRQQSYDGDDDDDGEGCGHANCEHGHSEVGPAEQESLPPNVDFEIDDIEEEWVFDGSFDYIHSRLMTSSIVDWKDNLTPGGYLELQEVDVGPSSDDGTLDPTTSALARYCALLQDASVKLGRPYQEIPTLADVMRDPEVGFVDVEVRVFKWPTNGWHTADTEEGRRLRELGVWSGQNIMAGLEGFAMAPFTRAFGWSQEDIDAFLVDVKREMRDKSIHAYGLVYSIVGKKPLA
ncbi:hypothetical protein CSAL01_11958 [Colletotrichum salicis]|uniref:Methyltransferase domain-containing protein n=1 Tax=Colletotrichum salicis TaxID=1209931 RepID=A0A135V433_9PEZI|nr:hypothetical protein CSAL01_11958 [Colletotrichum salicis]